MHQQGERLRAHTRHMRPILEYSQAHTQTLKTYTLRMRLREFWVPVSIPCIAMHAWQSTWYVQGRTCWRQHVQGLAMMHAPGTSDIISAELKYIHTCIVHSTQIILLGPGAKCRPMLELRLAYGKTRSHVRWNTARCTSNRALAGLVWRVLQHHRYSVVHTHTHTHACALGWASAAMRLMQGQPAR